MMTINRIILVLCLFLTILTINVCMFVSFDLNTLFDEVHRSNMSKACDSYETAQDTIKKLGDDFNDFTVVPRNGQFFLHRNSDWKLIKSHKYQPADLSQFFL